MGVSTWNNMRTIGPKLSCKGVVAVLGDGRGLRAMDATETTVAAATSPKTLSANARRPDAPVQVRVL